MYQDGDILYHSYHDDGVWITYTKIEYDHKHPHCKLPYGTEDYFRSIGIGFKIINGVKLIKNCKYSRSTKEQYEKNIICKNVKGDNMAFAVRLRRDIRAETEA